MPSGTVKWFNVTKGYGFIEPEDGGKDIFVHITAVQQSGLESLADGQKVSFELEKASTGWNAPALAPWLESAIEDASQAAFGAPAMYMGEGGTIPFMYMLGAKFPKAQFCVTGVLGPGSNAHGPNEFLHLEMAERLTACVAMIVARAADQA